MSIQNELLDRCEVILGILDATFSAKDPKKMKAVEDRYTQLASDGTDLSLKMAKAYLEWCLANPARINQRHESQSCRCMAGWILENEELNTYRPCPRCLPGAHDLWMTNFTGDEYSDGEMSYPVDNEYTQNGF